MKGSDGVRGTREGCRDLNEKHMFTVTGLLFSQWEQNCPEVGGSQDALEPGEGQ